MTIPKITREQLLAEALEHGTDSRAALLIAEKYGLQKSSVVFNFTKWGIIQELRKRQQEKLTEKILLQECLEHGTGSKACRLIGKKYGYNSQTIERFIYDQGIPAKIKSQSSDNSIPSPQEVLKNEIEAQLNEHVYPTATESPAPPELPERDKTQTEESDKAQSISGLRTAYLYGDMADYDTGDQQVVINSKRISGEFISVPRKDLIALAEEMISVSMLLEAEEERRRRVLKYAGDVPKAG